MVRKRPKVPINLDHVREAIEAKGSAATSVEIVDFIRERHAELLQSANPSLGEHAARQLVSQRVQGILQRNFWRNHSTGKWQKKGE